MKRVIIYVEGRSDKDAMTALLQRLIEQKRQEGMSIEFFEAPGGDREKIDPAGSAAPCRSHCRQ